VGWWFWILSSNGVRCVDMAVEWGILLSASLFSWIEDHFSITHIQIFKLIIHPHTHYVLLHTSIAIIGHPAPPPQQHTSQIQRDIVGVHVADQCTENNSLLTDVVVMNHDPLSIRVCILWSSQSDRDKSDGRTLSEKCLLGVFFLFFERYIVGVYLRSPDQ
jgi:hypothetical protein